MPASDLSFPYHSTRPHSSLPAIYFLLLHPPLCYLYNYFTCIFFFFLYNFLLQFVPSLPPLTSYLIPPYVFKATLQSYAYLSPQSSLFKPVLISLLPSCSMHTSTLLCVTCVAALSTHLSPPISLPRRWQPRGETASPEFAQVRPGTLLSRGERKLMPMEFYALETKISLSEEDARRV